MSRDEVRRLNPLEVADWDQRVARFPRGGFFHTTPWARVLRDTYGYEPIYLALNEDAEMRAALPLMDVKSWLTGRRGVSLPFTDTVVPLMHNPDDFRRLFAVAQEIGRERAWKYLEVRGGREFLPGAVASTAFLNHVLALEGGEATEVRRQKPSTRNPEPAQQRALFARCDESVRRAVRKAEKAGLTVEFLTDEGAMRDFYALLCRTRQRHGVPPQPFRFFAQIQRHVLAGGHGCIALVRHAGEPIAGAVYFHFGREVIYKFGASNLAHQNLRANNLVMWRAIERYAELGYATLDFGRTSLGNEGLRQFKLGWGTRERTVEYARFDLPANSFVAASDDSAGWHTRVFSRLPTWLARPVGAALYPHMG